MQVEIWSDVVCPWCYVGMARFRRAVEETGVPVEVIYRAFELDPTVPPDGPPLTEYLARKLGDLSRVRAANARLTSAGAELGIDFRWEGMHRRNTFDAHRLLVWALRTDGPATQGRLKERLLEAHFTEGLDVSDHATLADLAASVGLDRELAAEALATGAEATTVRDEEAAAHENGIAAVPTFVIEGKWVLQGALDTAQWARALPRLQAELDADLR